MADIIDFDQIQDTSEEKRQSLKTLLDMQEQQTASYTERLRATSSLCAGIQRAVEESCRKADIKKEMSPTMSYMSFLATPIDAVFNAADNPFFENKIPIFVSQGEDDPRYVFTMKIDPDIPKQVQDAAHRGSIQLGGNIALTLYRVNGWKCEVFNTEEGWIPTRWKDMTGLTKEQYIDADDDPVLAEMLREVLIMTDSLSNRKWNALKKENEALISFYRDPQVQRVTYLFADEDEYGKIFLTLQPSVRNKDGAALRCENGKIVLMMYGPKIMSDVCEFGSENEAKKFVRQYFDRFDTGLPSLTLPLSKDRVIEIDDLRGYRNVDLDRYVKTAFRKNPLTANEKKLLEVAKEIVEACAEMEEDPLDTLFSSLIPEE